jgi:hypothetical protein
VAGSHLGFAKKIFQGSRVTSRGQKLKFLAKQERWPRKGRFGGDRAAFATPSRVPSKEKNYKKKNPLQTISLKTSCRNQQEVKSNKQL